MKLLFDENISYKILKKIGSDYNDSNHCNSIRPLLKNDFEIWEYARKNNFSIVTFDEDFEQLEMLYSFPPKIILLKFGNASTQFIADYFLSNYTLVQDFIASEKQGLLELY